MYQIKNAENSNVDLLLDMKLDIIFNSKEILDLDKNEMEKIVNYSEEEIRENLSDYKLVVKDEAIIGTFAIVDYNDGKLIDTIYLNTNYRNQGIGSKIINKIIETNYEPIYLWVYKSNERAINLYKRFGFKVEEETETRFFMKNENIKKENDIIKARLFCKDVEQLSKKYKLEYFFVTEGASKAKVEKCDAVKTAKEDHIIWKNQNNADSYDDWGKDDENFM